MILSTWTNNPSNFFRIINVNPPELVNVFIRLSEGSDYPQTENQFASFIESTSFDDPMKDACFSCMSVCVSENKKEIMGFLLTTVTYETIDIDYLCVGNSFKRQGIAVALLKDLEQRIIKKPSCILLEVGERNLAARALYEKCGYSNRGVRKKYYRQEEDAICMGKDIKTEADSLKELDMKKKDLLNFIEKLDLTPKENISVKDFLNKSRKY
ncbi:MAG: GNAT family N-acetyltransferase [Bdellovibrionota bacterium]